jgi:aspartate/methionine/tyrosine aminotransferase
MFSNRLRYSLEENALWRALTRKRTAGDDVYDLTESNPTRIGLDYPADAILAAISLPESLTYQPSPTGLVEARQAIAAYYRQRDTVVAPDDIVLTSSTSEAYGFLFKLLCEPGDTVLVPRPSYPLHEFLASLDAVELMPYDVDYGVPDSLPSRCRAIAAVHPNNPTGAYVSSAHAERMLALSERHDVAVIVDEVFLDYPHSKAVRPVSFAGGDARGLVFVLSGLSKLAGLPQMKLGWIVAGGAVERRREAIDRLAHIADTYLSVGAPVQHATARLLELGTVVRASLQERVARNLKVLAEELRSVPEVSCPTPEGGWYAVVRLPAIASSEDWALDFLERASVYVHPGAFFGFGPGVHAVVSLLPPPERFREGVRRVLGVVADRVNSSSA